MSKTRKFAKNNKKAGNGNGNSVINNTEKASNYVSGEVASSSSHNFSDTKKDHINNAR